MQNKKQEELLELLYLGNTIAISQTINPNLKYETAKIEDNTLIVELKEPLDLNKKEIIREHIYKNYAPTLFLSRVEHFSKIMNLKPTKVSFRKAKTRWGSCSSSNNISLNIALTMLPQELSDYIIVHELAHIKHKNHSKDFWNCVERYYPNYKNARNALKQYNLT